MCCQCERRGEKEKTNYSTQKIKIMKTQSSNVLGQLNPTAVKELTTMVKETLDYGHLNNQKSTFSAADLWNIQRNRRSFSVRRGF